MSHKGVLVVFDEDLNDETTRAIVAAIEQIRGVGVVTAIPTDPSDYMARERVRLDVEIRLREAMVRILRGEPTR